MGNKPSPMATLTKFDNTTLEEYTDGSQKTPQASEASRSFSITSVVSPTIVVDDNSVSADSEPHLQDRMSKPVSNPNKPLSKSQIALEGIAKEFSALRSQGLVPTKPIPARTLLWEEMAHYKNRVGARKGCIFRQNGEQLCSCMTFKRNKSNINDHLCHECGHGAPWHKIVGGERLKSVVLPSSMQCDTLHGAGDPSLYSGNSSIYSEYYSEMEEDSDDEDIRNEVAMPMMFHNPPPPGILVAAAAGAVPSSALLASQPPIDFQQHPLHVRGSDFTRVSEEQNVILRSKNNSFVKSKTLGSILAKMNKLEKNGFDENEIELKLRQELLMDGGTNKHYEEDVAFPSNVSAL